MTLLILLTCWLTIIVLVTCLCAAARRGDDLQRQICSTDLEGGLSGGSVRVGATPEGAAAVPVPVTPDHERVLVVAGVAPD